MDDAELVARALAGSEEAFATLVERHQRMLQSFTERVLRDRDAADEATQRAFVHAYERLATFRGDAAFATWLRRIAMNECHDILRAQRRFVPLTDAPPAALMSGTPDPDPVSRRIRERLADLPPRQQRVFALRVLGDLPFAEVARAEGISENAAKVNFHHAVRRLRRWLLEGGR